MSGLEVPASIFAVLTVAGSIISLTSRLISATREASQEIEQLRIETSYLRSVIESIESHRKAGRLSEACLSKLHGDCGGTGLVAELAQHLDEIHKMLPRPKQAFIPGHFGGSTPKWELLLEPIKRQLNRVEVQRLLKNVQNVMAKVEFELSQDIKYVQRLGPSTSGLRSAADIQPDAIPTTFSPALAMSPTS